MEHGRWLDCPVCNGTGSAFYDVGADVPVNATCDACRGLGVAEFVEADAAEAAVRPSDLARHDAPYDVLAA